VNDFGPEWNRDLSPAAADLGSRKIEIEKALEWPIEATSTGRQINSRRFDSAEENQKKMH
jgi:hypothetical protein